MLKRLLSVLLTILLLTTNAFADTLPSLDEALSSMSNTDVDAIEISPESVSEFVPFEGGEFDIDGLRMIILERHDAPKEFTKVDVFPLSNSEDGLSDDYQGKDIGRTRVWLRCDAMRQIPDFCKATSLSDADMVVMAEYIFELSGTIIHTEVTYGKTGETKIPDWVDTIEELESFIAENEPIVKGKSYYPVFLAANCLSMYNPTTKASTVYDFELTEIEPLERNREAADYWAEMNQVLHLKEILEDESLTDRESEAYDIIQSLNNIDEGNREFWKTCIKANQYKSAIVSVEDYYWKMAEQLVVLDGKDENKAIFAEIINKKRIDTLQKLVNYLNYTGLSKSISSIAASNAYIAEPDLDWLGNALTAFVQEINEAAGN